MTNKMIMDSSRIQNKFRNIRHINNSVKVSNTIYTPETSISPNMNKHNRGNWDKSVLHKSVFFPDISKNLALKNDEILKCYVTNAFPSTTTHLNKHLTNIRNPKQITVNDSKRTSKDETKLNFTTLNSFVKDDKNSSRK